MLKLYEIIIIHIIPFIAIVLVLWTLQFCMELSIYIINIT